MEGSPITDGEVSRHAKPSVRRTRSYSHAKQPRVRCKLYLNPKTETSNLKPSPLPARSNAYRLTPNPNPYITLSSAQRRGYCRAQSGPDRLHGLQRDLVGGFWVQGVETRHAYSCTRLSPCSAAGVSAPLQENRPLCCADQLPGQGSWIESRRLNPPPPKPVSPPSRQGQRGTPATLRVGECDIHLSMDPRTEV